MLDRILNAGHGNLDGMARNIGGIIALPSRDSSAIFDAGQINKTFVQEIQSQGYNLLRRLYNDRELKLDDWETLSTMEKMLVFIMSIQTDNVWNIFDDERLSKLSAELSVWYQESVNRKVKSSEHYFGLMWFGKESNLLRIGGSIIRRIRQLAKGEFTPPDKNLIRHETDLDDSMQLGELIGNFVSEYFQYVWNSRQLSEKMIKDMEESNRNSLEAKYEGA